MVGITVAVGQACEHEECIGSVLVDLDDEQHPIVFGQNAKPNTCVLGHHQSAQQVQRIIADARRIWAREVAWRKREEQATPS